ncbi:MAG: Transposase [Parcubacteria group bacterium GW2011_GWE2_38_18]|nr:MAG: Transposase [Parcubacteria group bacterium GW2011_GWE2_38_18]
MKQPKFNSEQIAELLKNEHVIKCSKTITYSKEFKVLAVKQYAEGMTASQIFREAGFDLRLIGKYVPKNSLNLWRRTFEAKGEVGLRSEERGTTKGSQKGRPRIKALNDADRIKRLEIEVAYLKAKNDFLVKLRAQRKS